MTWTLAALLMLALLAGMVLGSLMTAVWLAWFAVRTVAHAIVYAPEPKPANRWGASTGDPMRTGEPAGWAN